MERRSFRFSHSLLWVVSLIVIEAALTTFVPQIGWEMILLSSIAGGIGIVVIAFDIIEEVRESRRMLALLIATILEFLLFFTFQYYFILRVDPQSFPQLASDPSSLLLHSTMVFALNPLYLPSTMPAKLLLLINTIESLVLALFILQNIWQIRRSQ